MRFFSHGWWIGWLVGGIVGFGGSIEYSFIPSILTPHSMYTSCIISVEIWSSLRRLRCTAPWGIDGILYYSVGTV